MANKTMRNFGLAPWVNHSSEADRARAMRLRRQANQRAKENPNTNITTRLNGKLPENANLSMFLGHKSPKMFEGPIRPAQAAQSNLPAIVNNISEGQNVKNKRSFRLRRNAEPHRYKANAIINTSKDGLRTTFVPLRNNPYQVRMVRNNSTKTHTLVDGAGNWRQYMPNGNVITGKGGRIKHFYDKDIFNEHNDYINNYLKQRAARKNRSAASNVSAKATANVVNNVAQNAANNAAKGAAKGAANNAVQSTVTNAAKTVARKGLSRNAKIGMGAGAGALAAGGTAAAIYAYRQHKKRQQEEAQKKTASEMIDEMLKTAQCY